MGKTMKRRVSGQYRHREPRPGETGRGRACRTWSWSCVADRPPGHRSRRERTSQRRSVLALSKAVPVRGRANQGGTTASATFVLEALLQGLFYCVKINASFPRPLRDSRRGCAKISCAATWVPVRGTLYGAGSFCGNSRIKERSSCE